MLPEVIKERMEVVGLTQAKLASTIGCTPTQLGLFIKGEASLNRECIDNCFKILGINIDAISKRIDLAKRASTLLASWTVEEVSEMSKSDMIVKTGIKEIGALPDVSKEDFELMVSSEIADYESTFVYFKAMVMHFMQIGDKCTPKIVESSFNNLARAFISQPFVPLLGLGVGSIIGAAVGTLALNKKVFSHAVNNVWAPLLTLAVNLYDRKAVK